MFPSLEVIGRNGIPHPFRPVFLLRLDGVLGIGHVSFRDRIGEETLLLLSIVQTESRAEIEAFEEMEIDVGITEGTPVDVPVVAVAVEARDRVLTVGIAAYRTCVVAFFRVDRE